MKFCPYFYEYLYIDNNEGNICLCPWMEPSMASIGNLMTDDVDEAYNSEYANSLRSTMDDQSFMYCRIEACPRLQNNDLEEISPEEYERRKKARYFPEEINMAYDFVCNQSCETCRKSVFIPPTNYAEQMRAIHAKLSPYLDAAKKITASGHGDPFASKYMMNVLGNLRPTNSELRILLETNGVFFDEAHWMRIKHLGSVSLSLVVTTNSFDDFTYKHISRGGDFQRLIANLGFMSELRIMGEIKNLAQCLVVQDRNFREIPSFIKRSFSDYAFDSVVLRPVYQWGTMDEDVYWFKDVLNPCHPYHAEYLEIMQDPALKDPRVYNFAGNTLHAARPFPGSGAISAVRFPYKAVKKDSRIVIYGAGQVGREYMRQIEETQYCEVVRWIDKNPDSECVEPPECLLDMSPKSYDAVVLAAKSPAFREEMKLSLKNAGVPDERIIYDEGCK